MQISLEVNDQIYTVEVSIDKIAVERHNEGCYKWTHSEHSFVTGPLPEGVTLENVMEEVEENYMYELEEEYMLESTGWNDCPV